MGRPRLRIATMLGLVLFCAVGFAAMRAASEGWARICFSLALGSLGFATLPLLLRRGEDRAYWVGFNVLGWGYLVACFTPWAEGNVRPHLVTTWAIERAAPEMIRPQALPAYQSGLGGAFLVDYVWTPQPVTPSGGASSGTYSGWPTLLPAMPPAPGDPANVQRIGHSLFALVFAVLGGATARRLAAVSES